MIYYTDFTSLDMMAALMALAGVGGAVGLMWLHRSRLPTWAKLLLGFGVAAGVIACVAVIRCDVIRMYSLVG